MTNIHINSYNEHATLIMTTVVQLATVEAEEFASLQKRSQKGEDLTDEEVGTLECYEERLLEMEGAVMGQAGIFLGDIDIALVEYFVEGAE